MASFGSNRGDQTRPWPVRLNVMTLNAWGDNHWPDREPAMRGLMQNMRPEIILLQEASTAIIDCIADTLPHHAYVTDGWDKQPGWCTESNIFYDATLLEEIEHGFSRLEMEDYPDRGLFWMRLRVRAHPERTIFVSTCHLPWPGCRSELVTGVNQRLLATAKVINCLKHLLPADEPCILGGDFNEDFHPRRLLSEQMGMVDVFEALDLPNPATHPARPTDPREDSFPSRTLDWIFTLLPASDRVISAFVKQPRTGFPAPSDHMPVMACLELCGGVHPYDSAGAAEVRCFVQSNHRDNRVEA